MPKLSFYDLKRKKKFVTDKYRLTTKKTKKGIVCFAVTKAPSGIEVWRTIGRDFYNKFK